MSTEFVWGNEQFLEMDSGVGYTMLQNSLNVNVHLKLIKMLNFMLFIFYHSKKHIF